ncbi:MAG: hypothetical protein MUF87_02400, partial [Anaerolineae bacterium]|nr:hypothetical protein [Anaerolineae bacterium]
MIDATFGNLLLTLPGASFPQWHRQNQRLAYVSTDGRLMRYDLSNNSIAQIASAVPNGYTSLDWHIGEGRNEFVYSNVYGLWKYDNNTATHTQLTFNRHIVVNPNGNYIDAYPRWSPSGNSILFERNYLNNQIGLATIRHDGGRFRPLNRVNNTQNYIRTDGNMDWA